MVIYYILYGTLISLYCEEKIRCSRHTKRTLVIAFIILYTVMLGFRHPSMGHDLGYGTDYGYLTSFHQLSKMSWKTVFNLNGYLNYEKGYILYNKLLGMITNDSQVLLFVTALISSILLAMSFFKLGSNHNILMSIVIYTALPCFLIQFSGLRQTIAIAICSFAVPFIESKKPVAFAGLVICASLFHTTALCFLFAYLAYWFPIKRKWRIGTLVALVFVFVFRAPLFQILARLIKRSDPPDNNGAITLFVVFTLVYLFCSLLEKDDQKINGYMNIFFLACACQAFSSVYSSAVRMGYYFMLSLPILLPMVSDSIAEFRQREIIRLLIYICFLLFGLYTLSMKGGWAMTNPYRFFFES